MNTYHKFAPNVFLAKCDAKHEKGEVIAVTTKYGKENESIVHNLIFVRDGFYYYSITRADGYNMQERARRKAERYEQAAANADKRADEYFDKSNYHRSQLTGNTFINAGDPAYRLTTNNNWHIVIKLSDEEAAAYADKSNMTVRFRRDNIQTTAYMTKFDRGGEHYADLSLTRYMTRYINDRYIDIDLVISSANGLKIPTSAIVTKEFYRVPTVYIITDPSDNKTYVMYKRQDEKGNPYTEKYPVTIYSSDEDFSYLDLNAFNDGDYLESPVAEGYDFKISAKGNLTGVYNINKGYALFRLVSVLYQNDAYTIVRNNTYYGLNLYDRIVINADQVTESQIISE